MQVVDHNPNAIVARVQMMFGTIDKGCQIISTRFGLRADSGPSVSPHIAVGTRRANRYRRPLDLVNANFVSNFVKMPSTGRQNTIKLFNTAKP